MRTDLQVPVFSRSGTQIGQVGQTVTSVGASKIAGGPVEYSHRFGVWGWIAKEGSGGSSRSSVRQSAKDQPIALTIRRST